jgi:hypothetical protein
MKEHAVFFDDFPAVKKISYCDKYGYWNISSTMAFTSNIKTESRCKVWPTVKMVTNNKFLTIL